MEYSDDYSKASGSLWQYCKYIPAVNNNGVIVEFNEGNATVSINFKAKITRQAGANGRKNIEIMVQLKYLNNFWRTLEMPLVNCEINLILTWSVNCVVASSNNANQGVTFAITDTKLYVPVVALSTHDNAKLLQQLKSGFTRIINWNKYLSKPELLAQNPILNHLVKPSFQGVNRLFVLAFENDAERTSNKRYHFPNREIKDYNVTIDEKNVFDQPVKNDKITYENITKIATGQGDDYTTSCLLDCLFLKKQKKLSWTFHKELWKYCKCTIS